MGRISTSPEKEREGIGIHAPEYEKIGTSVPGNNPMRTPSTPAPRPEREPREATPKKQPVPVKS